MTQAHMLKQIQALDGRSRYICACGKLGLFVGDIHDANRVLVISGHDRAASAHEWHVQLEIDGGSWRKEASH
jgi:hypothetical protein